MEDLIERIILFIQLRRIFCLEKMYTMWWLVFLFSGFDSICLSSGEKNHITGLKVPESRPIGPPRQLNLSIACEPMRPCISATWLPPLASPEERLTQDLITEASSSWNKLVAYRVRYLLVAPIDPVQNAQEQAEKLPFTRMVEKNVTRLQFSTTAGEHLFGVGYEVRVAAIWDQVISPEISERILVPEAAPSDAPTEFRVVAGDETSVHLGWKPPRFQYRNGKITHYQVRCYVLGAEESTENLRLVTNTELIISDLAPATHACLVRAWTRIGPGPWTNRVLFRIHGAVPPSPTGLQAFRLKPASIRLEWSMQNSGHDVVRFIIYYKTGTDLASSKIQWDRYVTESDALHATLTNLDAEQSYLFKVTSVDRRGRESVPSAPIIVPPATWKELASQKSSHGKISTNSQRPKLLSNPDYFAVRNLKCASQTSNSIGLEWLAPVESQDITEYEITLTGRKEFITSHGVSKAVHLGERQIRHAPQSSAQPPGWYAKHLGTQTPDQPLKFLQVTDLEPYSRYEFAVRPHYYLRSMKSGADHAQGVLVSVICETDWTRPELVEIPELEAIHKVPDKSSSTGTLIELRVYRVSERNGPLQEYFLLAVPYDCSDATSVNFNRSPEQFSLRMLSDNVLTVSNAPIPYLAIQASPNELFKPSENSAIIILGNEHKIRVRRSVQATRATKDDDASNRSLRTGAFDVQFGSFADSEINVLNKAIDTACKYRVALIACSKYPDGRRLCTSSAWSNPIDPKSSDMVPSSQITGTGWRNGSSSKFTAIVIGLTCGLVFFALLSLILGCVLRYRKRQLTERHILSSAPQWDAQICGEVAKSIHTENGGKSKGLLFKCDKRKRLKSGQNNAHPLALFYSLSSSGLQSPSNSSSGFHAMRPIYPSAGGLAAVLPGRSITSQSLRSTESAGLSNTAAAAAAATELMSNNYSTNAITCLSIMESPGSPKPSQGTFRCKHLTGANTKPNMVEVETTSEVTAKSPASPNLSADMNFMFTGRLPIPVHVLLESVHQNSEEWTKQIEEEFRTVAGTLVRAGHLSTVHGSTEQNKSKNRSQSVIPFDYNRVPLMHQYGTSKTDYINASYIDGYRKSNAYIAAQAPLLETMEDFWSMVWDQKCSTIVMLNQLREEQHEVKCERFWPIKGSCRYGTVSVTHIETTDLAYYVLRKFVLQRADDQRTIWQLQYTHWLEQGTPKLSTAFLTFLRRVGAIASIGNGPTIVVCEHGAERAGLYIAIGILLEQAKHEGSVDVPGLVARLRSQRMGMIETLAQYQFIYQATVESILDGNTEVPARHFFTHIQQLDNVQTDSEESSSGIHCAKSQNTSAGLTGFQLEFRKINAYAPNIIVGQGRGLIKNDALMLSRSASSSAIRHFGTNGVALLTENVTKNRILTVIPFDANRVSLCPIRGVDGSDYINASYVDGYENRRAYIACQAPMISTVEDFWRMIWEQKCQIIVMLCDLKEGGKEQCYQYWPSIKPSRYQFFVIDLTAEYNMAGHILREFKITDARDGESRTVRHLQFTRWPERGVPTNGDSLIDLIGQVQKMRALAKVKTPVTVHCSSGTGRTGVFITLSNVFERLRQESVVDMYATVKLLRQQRVSLVQTEEQYRFCYLATLDYLTSFDLYTQPTNAPVSALGSACSPLKLIHESVMSY